MLKFLREHEQIRQTDKLVLNLKNITFTRTPKMSPHKIYCCESIVKRVSEKRKHNSSLWEEFLKINRAVFMCGAKQFVCLILSNFNFSRKMIVLQQKHKERESSSVTLPLSGEKKYFFLSMRALFVVVK